MGVIDMTGPEHDLGPGEAVVAERVGAEGCRCSVGLAGARERMHERRVRRLVEGGAARGALGRAEDRRHVEGEGAGGAGDSLDPVIFGLHVLAWSETGQTLEAKVEVNSDLTRLKVELAELFPGSGLQVTQSQNAVVLSGQLERAEQADSMRRYLEAQKINFVDMTF